MCKERGKREKCEEEGKKGKEAVCDGDDGVSGGKRGRNDLA